MKKNHILLAALLAAVFAASGCRQKEEQSSVVMASSQDADGYVYEARNETVYAQRDVNIRAQATAKSDSLGILKAGESIVRTAYNYSWSKVAYQGKTCYMATQFLSSDPPAEETQEAADTEEETETAEKTETIEETEDTVEKKSE